MRGKIIIIVVFWLAAWQTALATTQLIVNGGFTSASYAPWMLQGNGVQPGPGYLSMGNANGVQQLAYQTVTFPTNLIAANLSLDYAVVSSNGYGDDFLTLEIADTSLSTLIDLGTIYSSSTTTTPVVASTNFITYTQSGLLSSYAGRTVDVLFYVATDANYGYATSFYISDVSLLAATTADIPVNDNFLSATYVTSTGITNDVTTTYASRENGEPEIAGNAGGHSLWWTWIAPSLGTVTVNTAGSGFTTLLGAYTGSSVTDLHAVASSDGANVGTGWASVKFIASAGAQYYFALDGYNGESGNGVFAFNFSTRTAPPKLTITSPKPAERWSNSVFNVTGKVADGVPVAAVWYRLNTNAWSNNVTSSNGWTNWNVEVTPNPGANTLQAFAVDDAGNASSTNSVKFIYVLTSTLTVHLTGEGKISPNDTNALLAIGNRYTITATAGKGFVFSNWLSSTGAVAANGPALKFIMESNLSFTANFVTNPFTPAVGMYQGLFYDTSSNGVAQESSGFVSAQVNHNGSFTARFLQGNKSFPVSGQFSLTGGWFTNALKAWNDTAIGLQLDLTNGDVLAGNLANPLWTAELRAVRAVFAKTNPAPQAGRYTLVLPGAAGTNSAAQPGGDGFGAMTVNSNGAVAFAGKLGDGTQVTHSAIVSAQGEWPFYLSLYSGRGMMLGWLTFTHEPDCDLDGMLYWFKPSIPAATLYPAGFTNETRAAGSAYFYTKGSPVLDLTNGYVLMQDGGLTQSISNQFFLASDNIVAGSNKLRLTLTTSTGLFQGAATNAEGKTISISGALLQKQTNGFGQFLNASQTGSVYFAPQ